MLFDTETFKHIVSLHCEVEQNVIRFCSTENIFRELKT